MKSRLAIVALAGGLGLALVAQQQPVGQQKKKGGGKAAAEADAPPLKAVETATESGALGLHFGPVRAFRVAQDQEATLAGGVRVAISENREIPVVNVYVFVPAGSEHDPANQAGLAEITATVVRTGGTAALTASALPERLTQLGAVLEASVSGPRTLFSLQVPVAGFDAAAGILRDLLMAPRLDPEALDTALGQMHETISQRRLNPLAGLTRIFRERLYQGGVSLERAPEYDHLDNIARSDIENFHRRYYVGGRAVVVVEGDIAVSAAKAKVESLFGDWKGGASPAGPGEQAKPATEALLFADRDDLRLSGFLAGHSGGKVSDPDLAAMMLLCEMLAGGPEARLPVRVGAAGGWRAEWNASWDAGYERPGEFVVRGSVEPPFTTLAIAMVKQELAKLREGSFTDREVETARTALLTKLAVRYQSAGAQARERGLARFHGLPADLLPRTYRSLADLTRADVARAAARNLQPGQVIAVAGNSALFDKPLATLGAKVEPVELIAPAARPLKRRDDSESLERGRKLLSKMQEALGGRARLAAIRDSSIRQEGVTFTGDRQSDVKLWDRWIAGDTYRQDQTLGSIEQAVFYNGKIAWVGRRGMVAPLPGPGVAMVRSELFRMLFRLALSDQDDKRLVADLGGGVLQITEGDSQGVRIYLDSATGLPQRLLYRIDFGNGASVAVDETLSEWKDFDGIKWPTRYTSKKNGRRSDDLTVVEARFNTALNVADLEKKP